MKILWFERKTYGYGWVPASWQGWLAMVIYVALIVFAIVRHDVSSHSASDTLYTAVPEFALYTALLIILCIWKGEKPRWQWGKKDESHDKRN